MTTYTLPPQLMYHVPRNIAGQGVMLTPINRVLCLSKGQMMVLLGIVDFNMFDYYLSQLDKADDNYIIPTPYDGGDYVGVQNSYFYSTHDLIQVAFKMAELGVHTRVLDWTFSIGGTVVTDGFAIDDFAMEEDPLVGLGLMGMVDKHSYEDGCE